jgi:DNA repair exonuclease SbcCD ATPase subunit
MAEMNEKNTKKQILTAYQKALDEVNRLKAGQLDPKMEKARARIAALKTAAAPEQVKGALEMLGESVKDIQEVMKVVEEKYKKVAELDETIELRSKELKDLYEISVEAESFAAMVDGRKKLEAELDEEITSRRKQWEEEKQHQQKEHNREAAEAEQAHARHIAEWEYEFNRHVKEKRDELSDTLAATKKAALEEIDGRRKKFNEEVESLQKREEMVSEIEGKLTDLEQELERVKATRLQDIELAKEDARSKAKTSYGIEVNALKKTHEAEMTVLKGKNESLAEQVGDLRTENTNLTAKLNEAYAKIQDVALKSLESQGNSRMVELSRSMASEPQRAGKN